VRSVHARQGLRHDLSRGSRVYWEMSDTASSGHRPSVQASIWRRASATDGYGRRSKGGSFIARIT